MASKLPQGYTSTHLESICRSHYMEIWRTVWWPRGWTQCKALKQKGTEQEYHDAFDALSSRLTLVEEHLLSCYLGGLEEETQLAVRMFTPKTVQHALCLANLQQKPRKPKTPTNPPLLPTPTKNYLGTRKSFITSSIETPPTNKTPNPNRRTLTSAEFSEKRAINQCFWCDEKYEPGHRCKEKKAQVFCIEAVEVEE